jgi:uncharacterized membrane protein
VAVSTRQHPALSNVPTRALALLTLTSLLLVASICVAWATTGIFAYEFLAVNLGLAWVPVFLAALLAVPLIRRHALAALPLFVAWLVFLPNAPYLITDLTHAGEQAGIVPLSADVAILLLAAICGVLAWTVSSRLVELALCVRYGQRFARVVAVIAGGLVGVGICVGKVLRWNSWDIVARPADLAGDVLVRFADPLAHARGLTLALLAAAVFAGIALAQSLLSDAGSHARGDRLGRSYHRILRKN